MQALWLRPFPAEQEPAPAISDGATNPKARSRARGYTGIPDPVKAAAIPVPLRALPICAGMALRTRDETDAAGFRAGRLLVHAAVKILVGFRILHLVEQKLHRVDGAHLHEDAAQHPHLGKDRLVDQQFFLAGA